jgi:hypothetical protein
VYGLNWFQDRFQRPSTVRWNGPFESSDQTLEASSTIMYEQLFNDTRNYLNQLKQSRMSIYTKCELLLHEYDIPVAPEKYYAGLCYCCLKAQTFQT